MRVAILRINRHQVMIIDENKFLDKIRYTDKKDGDDWLDYWDIRLAIASHHVKNSKQKSLKIKSGWSHSHTILFFIPSFLSSPFSAATVVIDVFVLHVLVLN